MLHRILVRILLCLLAVAVLAKASPTSSLVTRSPFPIPSSPLPPVFPSESPVLLIFCVSLIDLSFFFQPADLDSFEELNRRIDAKEEELKEAVDLTDEERQEELQTFTLQCFNEEAARRHQPQTTVLDLTNNDTTSSNKRQPFPPAPVSLIPPFTAIEVARSSSTTRSADFVVFSLDSRADRTTG